MPARPAAEPIGRLVARATRGHPPSVADVIRSLDAAVIGPGSFFTSLLPIFLVDGCREALAEMRGPVIYIANLVTEGRGMAAFTAGHAVVRLGKAIGRPVDVLIFNTEPPADAALLEQYARENKVPLPLGNVPRWLSRHRGLVLAQADRAPRSGTVASRRVGGRRRCVLLAWASLAARQATGPQGST